MELWTENTVYISFLLFLKYIDEETAQNTGKKSKFLLQERLPKGSLNAQNCFRTQGPST